LENVMQRALILCVGDEITRADIQMELESAPSATATATLSEIPAELSAQPAADDEGGLGDDLKSHEERLILDALRSEHGSRKNAATRLGISPRTLRYKLARMREAGIVLPG